MIDPTIQQLFIAGGGVACTVAAVKVQIRDLERRQAETEKCLRDLPKDYVPRAELMALLKAIESTAVQTHRMVKRIAIKRKLEGLVK